MDKKKNIAQTIEIDARKPLVKEFYDAILDPYEHPWLVTDEASLYDITLDEDDDLIKRINEYYGVDVKKELLGLPFWQLLDYLNNNRVKRV